MAVGNERNLSHINYRNCKSTDLKPSANDGDQIYELDTNNLYEFHKGEWYPKQTNALISEPSIDTGIATSGTNTTLTDITKDFPVNTLEGDQLQVNVDGVEYTREIVSNTSDTITINRLPGAQATAQIGSGENGVVDITVVDEGSADYTVEVIEGVENGDLDATFDNDKLTITLGMGIGDKASTSIGTGTNGVVDIEVDVAGATGNINTITVDANLDEADRALSSVLDGNDLTINLATEGDSPASVSMGSGEDGVVTIETDTAGTGGNLLTLAVDNSVDVQDRSLSSALDGNNLTVLLATEGANSASATIGSGANGTVVTEFEAGSDGNDYTIEVVTVPDVGANLDVSLVESDITVTLGNTPAVAASSSIGTGTDGTVNIVSDVTGVSGNSFTTTITLPETSDQELLATLDNTDITISLGTTNAVSASSAIGSGDDGTVSIVVDEKGVAGNEYTVTVDASINTEDRVLSAELIDTDLVVSLETEGVDNATADIGTGINGTIYLLVNQAGVDGNNYTVEVVQGDDTLNVDVDNYSIVVTLASAGNTASEVATNINTNHSDILTATLSGSGADAMSIEAIKSFTGGSNQLNTASNTATLIANAINSILLGGLTATASGDGSASLTTSEELKSFVNGDDGGDVSSDKNTATLIAQKISLLEGVTATASGTGADSILTPEAQKSFTGGDDGGDISTIKNTASAIATAISLINGFTATASGDGTDSIVTAEEVKSFVGGTNQLSATANTATLVADSISLINGFTATASGTGESPITEEIVQDFFTGGTNKLADASNTATLVAASVNDSTVGLTATASGDGTTSIVSGVEKTNFTGGGLNPITDDAKNTATLVAGAIDILDDFTAEASGTGETVIAVTSEPISFTGGIDTVLINAGDKYSVKSDVNSVKDFVFHSDTSVISEGNKFKINGKKSATIHISGTTTSHTIEFMGTTVNDSTTPIVGVKLGDINFTMSVSTTEKPESWYFSEIEGLKDIYFDVTAIDGGVINISGRMS